MLSKIINCEGLAVRSSTRRGICVEYAHRLAVEDEIDLYQGRYWLREKGELWSFMKTSGALRAHYQVLMDFGLDSDRTVMPNFPS